MLLLTVAWTVAARPGLLSDPVVESAAEQIRSEGLRAHIRFLADDLLETGTRGYNLAASYLAAQFAALGLEPAGSDGSYLQPVPLLHAQAIEGESSVRLLRNGQEEALEFGREALVMPDYSRDASSITVGYGVTAPELKHDDYAGVDVTGKIVALVRGAPASFPPTQRAHHSSTSLKIQNAGKHGAVGLLYLASRPLPPAQWKRIVRQLKKGGMEWVDSDGTPQPEVPASLQGRAYIGPAGLKKLLADGPMSAKKLYAAVRKGKPPVFELPGKVHIRTVTRHRRLESPNVVALLPGSDPMLRDERIVYTAHLDHLGVGEAVDGDDIYNGALDNAAGVAGLLEVARAFASLPEPPARSVGGGLRPGAFHPAGGGGVGGQAVGAEGQSRPDAGAGLLRAQRPVLVRQERGAVHLPGGGLGDREGRAGRQGGDPAVAAHPLPFPQRRHEPDDQLRGRCRANPLELPDRVPGSDAANAAGLEPGGLFRRDL
jgi:hypothetical protein